MSEVAEGSGGLVRVLVVDDEPLARSRLRSLLADVTDPAVGEVAEAASAVEAATWVAHHAVDVLLLDIHMPGADGLQLARTLRQQTHPPAVVFVTAHTEHALAAFELDAVDYLTKPVRLQRLQQALLKVQRNVQISSGLEAENASNYLRIQSRDRTERVAVAEVVFFKAEWKYTTVRTRTQSHVLEASLNDLEARWGDRFVRVHRNALVARWAIQALLRQHDAQDGEGWAVRLRGVPELLPVSRRQLAVVRAVLVAPA